MKKAIITGITGQDGAYLAKFLLGKGYKILGIRRNNNSENLAGLDYLKIANDIEIIEDSLLEHHSVFNIIRNFSPNEIYNLAAQSSVGQSFKDPKRTIQFNTISVLNILESIRELSSSREIRFYQASSSEMFGKTKLPIKESNAMFPLSPYAVSKASAHWSTINYRESFDIFSCCGILFNHESYLRKPDFFIKKILRESIEIKKGKRGTLFVGNLSVKRDFGYGPKYVEAMWRMLQQEKADDYIISSGESVSLNCVLRHVFKKLDISFDRYEQKEELYRPMEIEDIYGSNQKAKDELGWDYEMDFFSVLDLLLEEELENYCD